jgi:hypothetical protein
VLWQFFRLVAHNAEHFAALLPKTRQKFPCCCLQRRSFFRVVGNNAESAIISVQVCFVASINFSHYGPQRGKMIDVIASTAEI